MTVKTCRYWLAAIWFIGAGIILLLILARDAKGEGAATTPAMYQWFWPNVIPFITLAVTSVFVTHANAATLRENSVPVDRFVFFAAAGISVFYLAAMLLMLTSIAVNPDPKFADTLKGTSGWMVPLQAIVSAALGVFFVKPKRA